MDTSFIDTRDLTRRISFDYANYFTNYIADIIIIDNTFLIIKSYYQQRYLTANTAIFHVIFPSIINPIKSPIFQVSLERISIHYRFDRSFSSIHNARGPGVNETAPEPLRSQLITIGMQHAKRLVFQIENAPVSRRTIGGAWSACPLIASYSARVPRSIDLSVHGISIRGVRILPRGSLGLQPRKFWGPPSSNSIRDRSHLRSMRNSSIRSTPDE